MIPLLNDPPRERTESDNPFCSLEEIMETADIITFHVPLIKDGPDRTFKMAGENFFGILGKKPLLINTSRGEVIDTLAVISALRKGQIAGFTADVWENEPYADQELIGMCDIATPHIAGYSAEGKANGTAACVRAASTFFGYGLDDWYPAHIPGPAKPEITIDPSGKTMQQIVSEAVLASYDVLEDDANFRQDPARFENLRNFYPIRREFGAFKVNLQGPCPGNPDILKKIGFTVY
jgi:erythronate-4-phosphate dehydrogenase